jgi:ABC-type multidrug transport system permease subunit
MKSRIKYYVIPIVIAIFVCFSTTLLACPNCKDGFEATTTQASVGEAYSFTIYMLIAMPMIIVSIIATKIVRKVREHERQQQQA